MVWFTECCTIATHGDKHCPPPKEKLASVDEYNKSEKLYNEAKSTPPRSQARPSKKANGQELDAHVQKDAHEPDAPVKRREVRIMSCHNKVLQLQTTQLDGEPVGSEVCANGEEADQHIHGKSVVSKSSDGLMPFTRKSVRAMSRKATSKSAVAAAAAAAAASHGSEQSASSPNSTTSRKATLNKGVIGLRSLHSDEAGEQTSTSTNSRPSNRKLTSCVPENPNLTSSDGNDMQFASAVMLSNGELVPVTKENAEIMVKVVRGKDWKWNDEDGGPGKIGTIVGLNDDGTLSVYWHLLNEMLNHYRFVNAFDLAIAPSATRSKPKLRRRDSQTNFNEKHQTVIVFDWDDTLFPTTYIREDLELDHMRPMKDQEGIPPATKHEVGKKLSCCAALVIDLLQLAADHGQVILVTLAMSPWVYKSCLNFYPGVWETIRDLNIPVVYAQEGHQIDYNKADMMSDDEVESFWSAVKGKAIAREVEKFYSQYEGQSWKNIISIGDSNFERLGTQGMVEDYARDKIPTSHSIHSIKTLTGSSTPSISRRISVEGEHLGHVIKVRTKTFKMVDDPEMDELLLEIELLMKWLPLMVNLDDGFDINLEFLNKPEVFREIEETLRG